MEDNLLTKGAGIRNLLLLFPLLSPVDRRKLWENARNQKRMNNCIPSVQSYAGIRGII